MKLEVEVARIQLNSLPPLIAKRLLMRRDVASLVEAGSASIRDIGQFRYADIRDVLATAPLGSFVDVSGAVGAGFSIARSSDALIRVRGQTGKEKILPELSLLDPSQEIRLEGIRRLSERAQPHWPRSLSWRQKASDSPLADSEFGMLLDELQNIAEPVIGDIAQKLERAGFGAQDLVPTNTTYYESILGGIPWTIGVDEYVADTLMPHLTAMFSRNPTWGLRCIQASCVSERVDPVPLAASVSNDDLLSANNSIGHGQTPFAMLATYKLATSRASGDERFATVAQAALQQLFDRASTGDDPRGLDELLIALVKLTLSIMGQTEQLALAPVFWRRLAAFAHAALLLESMNISEDGARDLADWIAARLTRESAAVEILDQLAEPGWRADSLHGQELWATALLRGLQFSSASSASAVLSPAQLKLAESHLVLVAGLPDPLSGARRDWTLVTTNTIDADLLKNVDAANPDGSAVEPIRVWSALVHHAQIYRFSEDLLARIRDRLNSSMPAAGTKLSEAHATLILCCNLASTQGDIDLAAIAAARAIEAGESSNDPAWASLAASIVILAAGAAKDKPASLEWAAERLLQLAYRLPRGAPCAAFAATITLFQRLIPLQERRWAKALAVASSAAT